MPNNKNVRHVVTMPRLPKTRRAKISFHYLCGTTVVGADSRVSILC